MVDFSKSFYFSLLYRIVVLQPQLCRNIIGLGWSAFARHYLRNHCYFLFLWVLRCFSSPRLLTDWQCDRCCLPGCPIRRFADRGIFAPPRNFSQLITSFFASESLGILHSPLLTFFCRGLIFINPGYGIYFALARFFVLCLLSLCQISLDLLGSCVENNGFEPLTPCVQSRCSSQLS